MATVAGNTVTIVGVGTTTITASQAGDANYNAAANVGQALTVNKTNQTITFAALADKTFGDAAFAISATATSGLAVSFNSTSDKITIAAGQVTLVKAGRTTITASQTGNTNYNAATSVDRSFCIKPAKPTITLSNTNTESPTLTSSATTGNQWFLNGSAISGATNATYSATQAGIYKVQVKVDDCVSDFSTDQTLIVTGDIDNSLNARIEVYPNPVSDWFTVSLGEIPGKKNVAIYQLNGTQTEAQETSGNEVRFYVGGYSVGIYLVKVKTADAVNVMRFVKN